MPVLSGTDRTCQQDMQLGGHTIPRRTLIWCNLNAAFRNPALWEEPDAYKPVCTPLWLPFPSHLSPVQ